MNKRSNVMIRYALWLTLLCAVGCTEREPAVLAEGSIPVRFSLQPVGGVVVAPEGANTVSLYVCDQGKIVWLKRVNADQSDQIDLPVAQLGNRTAYCVVNETVCLGANEWVVGDSEEQLETLVSSYHAGAGVDHVVAMGARVSLEGLDHASSIEMKLKRNMARFDLVFDHADIIPKSIEVKGLPAQGGLFGAVPRGTVEQAYHWAALLPDTARSGVVVGAFYAHEFDATTPFKPRVEITALYGDVALKSYLDIPIAERNKRYRIHLKAVDGELKGDILVDGAMEWGDESTPLPNETGTSIFIHPTLSTLSADVVLDNGNRRLTFPTKGGEATIFLTGQALTYLGQEGSLAALTIDELPDGSYKLTVAPNRTIEPAHEAVVLKFAEKTERDPNNFTRIGVVVESFAPFDVVTMAHVDWTPVNAQGSNIASYPVLKNGATLRNLIKGDWNRWSGTGEQWGPRPGNASGVITRFAAWFNVQWSGVSYQTLPYVNGAIIGGNNLTRWDNHPYCPEGWRLPTRAEFAAIWPQSGTVIDESTSPVTYTTAAGTFTAAIEKIGNNCLVISDGVQELIFPLAGFREHNGIHNPGNLYNQHGRDVGSSVYYWCYDRPVGGDAQVYGYEKEAVSNGAKPRYTVADLRQNAAAWFTSRCVRTAK